jgi:hypothetical protein
MGMFSMSGVKDTKVVSNTFLRAGIHNVTFKGLDLSENGQSMEVRFEAVDGSGVHNERIFAPRSDERQESQFGPNPSEAEQFKCKVKQVISALAPQLNADMESGAVVIEAADFAGFVRILKSHLTPYVGAVTQIKLVPTSGSYVGFPGYPGRLNRDGVLYMTTKFIGNDLTLTNKEKQAIDAALNAKPTDMRTKSAELDDLADEFSTPAEEDDSLGGLPF